MGWVSRLCGRWDKRIGLGFDGDEVDQTNCKVGLEKKMGFVGLAFVGAVSNQAMCLVEGYLDPTGDGSHQLHPKANPCHILPSLVARRLSPFALKIGDLPMLVVVALPGFGVSS